MDPKRDAEAAGAAVAGYVTPMAANRALTAAEVRCESSTPPPRRRPRTPWRGGRLSLADLAAAFVRVGQRRNKWRHVSKVLPMVSTPPKDVKS